MTTTIDSSATVTSFGPMADRLMGLKGNFAGVSWTRPMKTRKGVTATVTKSVRATVQVGLNYDNRKVVKEARADGSAPAKNAGLPWGKWEAFPLVVSHNDKRYVRLYPVRDEQGNPRACKVIYRINGQVATRGQVAAMCRASEFSEGTPTECYTLSLENLMAVRVVTRRDAKVNLLGKK